jgi:hypothetical protein
MPRVTKADLERWAVSQVLRHIDNAYVALKVGEVYAYPGFRTPWEAFKDAAGSGGGAGDGRIERHGPEGITASAGGLQVKLSWRRACGIALRDGLILRAIADAYPVCRFVFARNAEAHERLVKARRASTEEDDNVDLSQVRRWEDPDGQVQCRDGRRTHQGRPGGRREVPVVRE